MDERRCGNVCQGEEDMFREKIKEVRLSGFIEMDKEGKIIFFPCKPCPKCGGKESGEEAGIFECPFCGWSPISKYSSPHSMFLTLEGTWKLIRLALPNKRLRWMVSERLYNLHSSLMTWYMRGRHRIGITDGDYLWSWAERKWKRFL